MGRTKNGAEQFFEKHKDLYAEELKRAEPVAQQIDEEAKRLKKKSDESR